MGYCYYQTYLAKVYFVEHDFVGVANAPKSGDESQRCEDHQRNPVIPLAPISLCLQIGLDQSIKFRIARGSNSCYGGVFGFLGGHCRDVTLPHSAWRRRHHERSVPE